MTELEEKLKEAEEIARQQGIPFFASFAADEDGKEYKNFCITPLYVGKKLINDYITPLLLVVNGFPVLPTMPETDSTYESIQKMKKVEKIDIPREIT